MRLGVIVIDTAAGGCEMESLSRSLRGLIGAIVLLATILPTALAQTSGGVNVLTQAYDIARTGANINEVSLTPSNVSSATFGKLFAFAVDERVFAQPLYVSNLGIGGGVHNTVFIATAGNSVYAFDADNASTAATPLWSVNLGAPIPNAKYFLRGGFPLDGVVGTPVIDPSTNTLYLVAPVWNTASQTATQSLHALDLASGSEKFGGPVQISGTGFNADSNWQRSGLLLLNGVLYVPFSSHFDLLLNAATQSKEGYSGLIIAYDAATLAQVGIFNAEPKGSGGSVWQSGRGPASDGTYIYAMTANAQKTGTGDLAENFVELNPGTLTVADYYADPNAACLNTLDLDLSSSGPLIMPGNGTNLMVGGGKQGKVYVFQLSEALHTQTPQTFWGTSRYALLPADGGTCADSRPSGTGWISSTAFWNNSNGALYYIFGGSDYLYSYQLAENAFTQTSADTPSNSWPNALAVSANGSQGGILWAVSPQPTSAPVLYAFNAAPSQGHLTKLWDTTQQPNRDVLGDLAPHAVPTVANGMVYVATGSNQVAAYGLLPASPTVQITPKAPTLHVTALSAVSETITINSFGGYAGKVTLSVGGSPPGASYTLSKTVVSVAAGGTATSKLTISLENVVFPLQDSYTLVVQGTAGGVNSYAPIRLLARAASFTAVSKLACNSSNQMSANLTFKTSGSELPTIWIQDPTTPAFPGRLWTDIPASGAEQTGYWIDSKKQNNFYWIIDESAGAAAIFDNALAVANLSTIYSCP
jgi:hypothetical protein